MTVCHHSQSQYCFGPHLSSLLNDMAYGYVTREIFYRVIGVGRGFNSVSSVDILGLNPGQSCSGNEEGRVQSSTCFSLKRLNSCHCVC